MSNLSLLGALPPQKYEFKNWDYFQTEVFRFHNATRPDENQVIDIIATFRSLMSADVIEHLGSLVHLHPRFRTTDGIDEWLLTVTDALRGRDSTIKDPITAVNWVEQFKKGKANARQFWTGLDLLASKGEISSDEQRQLFWDAHSWEKQGLLVDRCPYFDPNDSVWDQAETSRDRMMAEQLLCRIMALSKVDDKIRKSQIAIFICSFVAGILFILGVALIITLIHSNIPNSDDRKAGLILGSIYSLIGAAGMLIPILIKVSQVRELRRTQRESRLHERV